MQFKYIPCDTDALAKRKVKVCQPLIIVKKENSDYQAGYELYYDFSDLCCTNDFREKNQGNLFWNIDDGYTNNEQKYNTVTVPFFNFYNTKLFFQPTRYEILSSIPTSLIDELEKQNKALHYVTTATVDVPPYNTYRDDYHIGSVLLFIPIEIDLGKIDFQQHFTNPWWSTGDGKRWDVQDLEISDKYSSKEWPECEDNRFLYGIKSGQPKQPLGFAGNREIYWTERKNNSIQMHFVDLRQDHVPIFRMTNVVHDSVNCKVQLSCADIKDVGVTEMFVEPLKLDPVPMPTYVDRIWYRKLKINPVISWEMYKVIVVAPPNNDKFIEHKKLMMEKYGDQNCKINQKKRVIIRLTDSELEEYNDLKKRKLI